MRPLRTAALYLLFVFLGGALLAPWIYWGMQWLAGDFSGLSSWAKAPFYRFIHRAFLLLALVGLPTFLKSLGSWDRSQFRAAFAPPRLSPLLLGFGIGFLSLAMVLVIEVISGERVLRHDHPAARVAGYLAASIGAAVAVALIEEILFRWALFGALRRVYARSFAVLLSSAVYALVHFFNRPEAPTTITWTSGIVLLPRMLRGFADFHALVPGFFCLVLAGSVLACVYDWTDRLWLPIGLHGGWIFWLKSYGFWTESVPSHAEWFWGSDKVVDGLLALILLCFCYYIVSAIRNRGFLARK